MKTSYKLKRVCGSVYSNGNAIFTKDGNSVISPVGNQVIYV
jgi:periodic tryptophan protein 2